MRKALNKLNHRLHGMRAGSVLILVVALLVLMALIGTAFLSTTRVDRYSTVQHTNNTEIDLLVEGVKNMAKGTIVGSLNDPSLPFPYRPANSSIAKNWDMPDLYHQYTTDALISTTPNDAWLSPRTPSVVPIPYNPAVPPIIAWSCIGEPLTGNTFESPFVLQASGYGNASLSAPRPPLTYTDRISYDFVPPTTAVPIASGNRLTPTYATLNYADGSSATFPAFALNVTVGGVPGTYTYLAGDADGDGIADCGMFKLPVGPIDGVTYYAGVRIIDNCAAVNVNTALSRRYDLTGGGIPTRYMTVTAAATGTTTAVSTPNYNGVYNLGCFPSNVGLAELLQSYDGSASDNGTGSLGSEFQALVQYHLNFQAPNGVIITPGSPSTIAGTSPVTDQLPNNILRTDFAFTTVGDLLTSQIGRRPGNPGNSAAGYQCLAFTESDAADLAYHFVFNNPNVGKTALELTLHNSVYDDAPNGPLAPPVRAGTSNNATMPGTTSTSYVGTPTNGPTIALDWYAENFDWGNDAQIGMTQENSGSITAASAPNSGVVARPRRSIFTADSAVSNLVPQPQLTVTGQLLSAGRPFTVTTGIGTNSVATGMSVIPSTLCKASINTASFADIWRAYWLAMTADNGLSPLGTNSGSISGAGYTAGTLSNSSGTLTASVDHDLVTGQSIYTGSQFQNPAPANASSQATQKSAQFLPQPGYPQHPQAMFRSTLRNPTAAYYGTTGGTAYSYIEADQMVLLRSAIAAANATAMRYPVTAGVNAPVFAYDVPLTATINGTLNQPVFARVYGVPQQPYITEVYVNTNTSPSQDPGPTFSKTNSKPYVAVELFNPYNQDIQLNGWQLATVDRQPSSNNIRALTVLHTFGAGDSVPHYRGATNGTTVYQGGYALLENFDGSTVQYRPASSNLDATAASLTRAGSVTAGVTINPLNDIYIPEFSTSNLIPLTPSVANEELVLLRPLAGNATAPETTVDQVPVDSYDFTGLNYGNTDASTVPPTAIADVWHYVRGNAVSVTAGTPPIVNSNSLWRFIYPGRYDASDPMPYLVGPTVVAPRADMPPTPMVPAGSRAVANNPAYVYWSRRQQGTQAARYRPTDTVNPINAQDPFSPSLGTPSPQVTLGEVLDAGGAATPIANDNPLASYPVTFPFQYLNNDQPGPFPIVATVGANAFPFGQFARISDILQVPFVGSYVIFSAKPTGYPATGVGASSLSAADVSSIIEVNPLPMDCSFAEDTDTTDDPPNSGQSNSEASIAGATGNYIWNESVGHFAPINTQSADNVIATGRGTTNQGQIIADSDPTLSYISSTDPYTPYKVQYSGDSPAQEYWRYHWASRIFDYLTVQNPNDDYFPNVQQNLYQTITGTYSIPVQNSAAIAPAANTTLVPASGGDPAIPVNQSSESVAPIVSAEDTTPVYGPININTAPWRVLSALRICPYDDAESGANQYTVGNSVTTPPGGVNGTPVNTQLAEEITNWRDVTGTAVSPQVTAGAPASFPYTITKGPFTSMADLLNVPGVQSYLTQINSVRTGPTPDPEPDAVQGHLSPFDFYTNPPAFSSAAPNSLLTDGVRNDVEERFDLLSRLSNQITLKSDVYTVYIVVQGWRNAGSTSASNPPQMVSQRRAAFILDRTGVTPTSSNVKVINVPTD